jgi:hypothetical protein
MISIITIPISFNKKILFQVPGEFSESFICEEKYNEILVLQRCIEKIYKDQSSSGTNLPCKEKLDVFFEFVDKILLENFLIIYLNAFLRKNVLDNTERIKEIRSKARLELNIQIENDSIRFFVTLYVKDIIKRDEFLSVPKKNFINNSDMLNSVIKFIKLFVMQEGVENNDSLQITSSSNHGFLENAIIKFTLPFHPTKKTCKYCTQSSIDLKMCNGQCEPTLYCSRECQKKDRKRHKNEDHCPDIIKH